MQKIAPVLCAWTAAFVGIALFHLADLPLPFLLGPLFGCLAAALLRLPMAGAGRLGTGMRAILGVAIGASVTPALIARLPDMALSVALIPVLLLLAGALGYPFFRRVCGFDWATSWYSAMPGGLQDMLAFGEEAGGDVRALSLIHATRVLVIVTLAPVLLTMVWAMPLTNAPGAPVAEIPIGELALMALAGALGWAIAARIGMFGAAILGPLIAAAALSLSDLIHHRPPAEAIILAQIFIGLGIGVKYAGITLAELRKDVLAGLGHTLILLALSALFVAIVAGTGLAPPVEAFLAFAPGGQAEMAVLAIVAGADIAFIVTHHLVRITIVILGAPIAAQMLGGDR